MNLEIVTVASFRSQAKMSTEYINPLTENPRTGRLIYSNRSLAAWRYKQKGVRVALPRTQTFAGHGYFQYSYCGDGFKGVYVCQNRLNRTL